VSRHPSASLAGWRSTQLRRKRAALPRPADGENRGQGLVGRLGLLLLANLSALTALLVYFGWRRSKTQAKALGIDESLLGMSIQEYVLRSVGPVFGLLAILGAAGLIWLWIDYWITRMINRRPSVMPWLSRILAIICPVPFAAAVIARARWSAQAYVAFPLAVAAGPLLLLYRAHLNRVYVGRVQPHFDILRGLIALGTAACLFWSASNYAEVQGDSLANQFAEELSSEVGVVVYSTNPLHIDASGVHTEVVGPEQSTFRYRYTGLKMLDHRGSTYFLVPADWTLARGVVIVLPDDDRIRLEFVRN
jgi:hypothetical protein